MAVIQENKSIEPTTIQKFLGLNLSNTGDTQIALGESGNMKNFYITDDYKLRKIFGYNSFAQFSETDGETTTYKTIRGMFATKIGNTQYLLVAVDGKLYYFLQSDLDNEDNWGKKKNTFKGDGETAIFDLLLDNIKSVDSVYVNGELIEAGNYTVNLVNGTVTFEDAPLDDANILINFTKHLEPTLIGSITDTDASFFEFDNKVYILCGGYYKWDGTTLSEVEGYTPLVFINTPAGNNGGGTIYDEINMLSPKKRQTFNGDGSSRTFKVAQDNITSIEFVKVGGTQTSDYTVNTTTGIVTINTAPPQGYDNVEICWSKDDGDRDIIEGMRFGTVFGGDVDTRVFLYGNPNCQNRVYYSGTTFDGDVAVPSVEYFPATAQLDIGPSNFAVTDLTRQYDRLLATTNKPEAYYLTLTTEQLTVTLADNTTTTRYVPSVKTLPLNETHGNIAMGQGQVLMNYPVTFEEGAIIQWKATNVRDEKNADEISQKIRIDLENINTAGIKTLDLQERNQLWIVYDYNVWIYNYYNKTYSKLYLPKGMNNITSLNGNVYMSTVQGELIKFSENFATFDGETIDAYWEMNFADFGVPYLRKTMTRMWVSMQPQTWSTADISFISNRAESTITKHIEYKKQWFDNVDFSDWSFSSSINPQPFRLKLKAKKFTNLKITIKNEENSACTILSLVLQVDSFGYSK